MRRLSVTLDDETSDLLSRQVNQAEFIRKTLRLHHGDITTDDMKNIKVSYRMLCDVLEQVMKLQKEMDSKIDYLAKKLQ